MAQQNKSAPVVGLDVGSYSIKCLELSQEPSGAYQFRRVSILPLDAQSAGNPAGVQKILKAIFEPYEGRPERLRISVSGSSVLIRRIKLPVMTPAELKGAIVFEAESQIPFPINDCQLDFQILNNEPDSKTMNVLLVATKKDFIQDRIKILSTLNVLPEVIDVDIFCLMNAFEALGEDGGQKTYGLLNIGHAGSSFAILQNNLPFVVREIPLGGSGVTKNLAQSRGISEEEADRLKIERPEALREELKNATRTGYEALIEEIKHSIDYFENETGEELKNIWVSGGGALAEGTLPILSEELAKQAQFWDNLKKMEVSGDMDRKYLADHSQELNVALGMALRRRGPKS